MSLIRLVNKVEKSACALALNIYVTRAGTSEVTLRVLDSSLVLSATGVRRIRRIDH